jgi:hypothetical protein
MALEGGEEKGEKGKIRREAAEYDAAHHKFRTLKKEYAQQYAPLYYHRLQKMRPRLLQAAKERWEGAGKASSMPRVVGKILELRPGEEVIVAGTLYKEMPLRPNILESYAKEVCPSLPSPAPALPLTTPPTLSVPSSRLRYVPTTSATKTRSSSRMNPAASAWSVPCCLPGSWSLVPNRLSNDGRTCSLCRSHLRLLPKQ